MNFKNAAGTRTIVTAPDFDSIMRAHNVVTKHERSLVTMVCLTCQSIAVSPDPLTKSIMQANYDMVCCEREATILP